MHSQLLQAGVTTDEIDKAVHKMIIENGAYPSPLTYGVGYIAARLAMKHVCMTL